MSFVLDAAGDADALGEERVSAGREMRAVLLSCADRQDSDRTRARGPPIASIVSAEPAGIRGGHAQNIVAHRATEGSSRARHLRISAFIFRRGTPELRDTLQNVGVEYVMATYADGHGIAKCKTVPIDHFAEMMRGSELFTGAALDLLGQSPADDELAVFPEIHRRSGAAAVATQRGFRARQSLSARRRTRCARALCSPTRSRVHASGDPSQPGDGARVLFRAYR